jgi:hypothetical protein
VSGVTFPVPASKRIPLPAEGAFGGLVRLRVSQAGRYRVSLDSRAWVDVSANSSMVSSVDFNGSQGCTGPHKIVAYDLPIGTDLTLQLSGATDKQVRFTLTPVASLSK